ncbi:MAG: hypothetical protein Q8879_03055, partial [Candidatus Phytoplasma australasiaticum]|nr:hypothetical protein [Candidatus Phytoplasma australasiaticum]
MSNFHNFLKLLIKFLYVYSNHFNIDYSSQLIPDNLISNYQQLINYGILCNSIAQHDNEKNISCFDLLDSVDRSFLELAKFLNIDINVLRKQYKLI